MSYNTIIRMVLSVKVSRGIDYLYFQAGKDSIYIGPKDDPAKAKPENVIRALDYSRERVDHYLKSFDELLPFLPEKTRKQYLTKQIVRLESKIKRYASML